MHAVRWLLVRFVAALSCAALIGLAAALLITILDAPGKPWLEIADELLFFVYICLVLAVVLGTLPAFVALTMTPAKEQPWRSLPILVVAALVGVSVCLAVQWTHPLRGTGWYALLFALPTATGLTAGCNIRRLSRRMRQNTSSKAN
jgi:hypothetical protein